MNNKEPQYETMLEHYLLCLNDDCTLADGDLQNKTI